MFYILGKHWGSFLFWMLLLIMTVEVKTDRTEATTSSPEIINRLNYGIMYKEESKLFLTSEYWLHTYEIQLPITQTLKFNDVTCPFNNSSVCLVLDNMLENIQNSRNLPHINWCRTRSRQTS